MAGTQTYSTRSASRGTLSYLLRFTEPGVGVRVVPLGVEPLVMGSSEGAEVCVQGPGVMGRHCVVSRVGERVLVKRQEGGVRGADGREVAEVFGEVPFRFELGSMDVSVERGAIEDGRGDATIVWDAQGALTGGTGECSRGEVMSGEPTIRMKYALKREIARGGMARVYCAHDAVLNRLVAVKMVFGAGSVRAERLRREAEILGMLEHPNIVPVHGLGTDDGGRSYYAMKLVGGRSLQAILNEIREGRGTAAEDYPLPRLISIYRRVCDALAFAHSRGVIHRDVKPENIMVGGYGEVLLMDWGLAKVMEAPDTSGPSEVEPELRAEAEVCSSDPGMTMEGEVVGTPRYMSPEQSRGLRGAVDERSDVYSLGGVLYALITLRAPVDGIGTADVLARVRRGEVAPMDKGRLTRIGKGIGGRPEPVALHVPESLKAICQKAMALDPSRRYESVQELAADIDAHRNGFLTRAEGASMFRRIRLWMKRNPVLTAAASIVAVVSGISGAKVLDEGRKASGALRDLAAAAPGFATGARAALRRGDPVEALRMATFAVKVDGKRAEYHLLKGCALQLLLRWPEAVMCFEEATRLGGSGECRSNLLVTKELLKIRQEKTETAAAVHLFEWLVRVGRFRETVALAPHLGDYWTEKASQRVKDPRAIKVLEEMLDPKMLPVPGTKIFLCKTEFTRAEWQLYMKAEGLPYPEGDGPEGFHPVTEVTWADASAFCAWFSQATGRKWRLPTWEEWSVAVGEQTWEFPWEGAWPPPWDRGNYSVDAKGLPDKATMTGADGFAGTSPVGSFKPNTLGFYDLGGNVWEFVEDVGVNPGERLVRGASWGTTMIESIRSKGRRSIGEIVRDDSVGFRIALDVTEAPPPAEGGDGSKSSGSAGK